MDTTRHNIPVLIGDEEVRRYSPEKISLVNGIGSVGDTRLRRDIFLKFKSWGYSFLSVLHPSAVISDWASMGEGVQVLAGAVLGPGSIAGDNVIINTRSAVDHDCRLGNHVHIAPGAVLSGMVMVGDGSHIGTGAVVKQGISIGKNSVIGAGSVVVRDIGDGVVAYGCPARIVT